MAESKLYPLLIKLNQIRSEFGIDPAFEREQILKQLSKLPIRDSRDIKTYHDLLLFYIAYPDNPRISNLCKLELLRLTEVLRKMQKDEPDKFTRQYDGSGIAFSSVSWLPSFEGCRWLIQGSNKDLQLVWSDEFVAKLGNYLTQFASPAEQDGLIDNRFDAKDWLMMASGNRVDKSNHDLKWLIRNFELLSCETKTREQLFEALGVEIKLQLNDTTVSRTGNILKRRATYYQNDKLLKSFDTILKVNEPVLEFKALSGKEKSNIQHSTKSVLAARERETDPVFYAQKIYKATVERGLDVYLFMMDIDHRLPIENYTGFVAYRNGVPIGYGGGWIFIDRCEIGVNIFETFRGGENNLIFTNIMRVYNQVFGVSKFVVQPYQFGEDNEEGLQSGAFWFYYKLGYRPSDSNIRVLAEKEWNKIISKKGYRSSISTLKKFTESPVELILKKSPIHFEPKQLSIAITRYVAKKFDGNHQAALAWSMNILKNFRGAEGFQKWSANEKYTFKYLSILIAACTQQSDFSEEEQVSIVNLLRKKGSDELAFSLVLKKEIKLLNAMKKFVGKFDFKG
ncbi:MAG TPA: hypothetical protein PKD91_09735 [Bacteroidia bacterium]|nr:hypothetical protein [Bacteroidia bacterium]